MASISAVLLSPATDQARQRNVIGLMDGRTIAVVGPCAAGKTTLVRELRLRGYAAREVAQEHSIVSDLARRRGARGPVVFLDVSPEVACVRRGMKSVPAWWASASARLEAARSGADLRLRTDEISRAQVLEAVLDYLGSLEGFADVPLRRD